MPSPYYPFKSLTGRGRYFFPSRAKEKKKQKKIITPDLRLQDPALATYECHGVDWQILAATKPAKSTIILTQFNEVSHKRIIISSENIKKEYKQSYIPFFENSYFVFPTEFQAALGAWEIKQRKATK